MPRTVRISAASARKIVILAALMLVKPAFADDMLEITPETPKAAPAINVKDTVDTFHTLDPKTDKLTVLHFWATWCVPCVAELPKVDTFYDDYKDKGVNVIAISMDGGAMSKVKAFYLDHQITHLKPYLDANGDSSKNFGIRGLPTTVFLNQKGEEIGRVEGPLDWTGKSTVDFLEKTLELP